MNNMNSSELSESTNSKRGKMAQKRQKAKEKSQHQEEEKPVSKQQIRKEKNRLAAQKSRDRRQQHMQHIEKENEQLKNIISVCQKCSQAHQQMLYSLTTQDEEMQENDLFFREHSSNEEPILISSSPHPTFSPPSLFLRHEEDSNSSHISKYFWFCIFVAVICVANYAGGSKHYQNPHRMTFQINNFTNYSMHEDNSEAVSNKGTDSSFAEKPQPQNERFKKSLMYYSSKQCAKCMECFRNMTTSNSTSLSTLNTTNNLATNQTLTKNSTNKILFCKSKALFFKKIYKALQKIEKSATGQVARVQASGKMLSQFMDKECFSDSQIDQNQLYNLEFTVAIMELTAVKDKPFNLTRNVQANE